MSTTPVSLGTTNPSIVARHVLGIPYTVTVDPYQVERIVDTGLTYLRYQSTDNRCWIHRVTVTGDLTTLEKTFGQWDSRAYHTYVPINAEYSPEYFATRNFDRYYVMSLLNATLNGNYFYRGVYATYDSNAQTFDTSTATLPMFVHEDFGANVDPVQALIIYDTYTQSWVLMTGDPDDALVALQVYSSFPGTYLPYIVPNIGAADKPFCGTYIDSGLRWTYIPDVDPQLPGTIGTGDFVAFTHPQFEADTPILGVVAYNPDAATWDLYEVAGVGVPYTTTLQRAEIPAPVLIAQPIPPSAVWPNADTPTAIVSLIPLTAEQVVEFTP